MDRLILVERRSDERLSDETFFKIVEAAAERAEERIWDNLYKEVGKGVVRKTLYILGALLGGLVAVKWSDILKVLVS